MNLASRYNSTPQNHRKSTKSKVLTKLLINSLESLDLQGSDRIVFTKSIKLERYEPKADRSAKKQSSRAHSVQIQRSGSQFSLKNSPDRSLVQKIVQSKKSLRPHSCVIRQKQAREPKSEEIEKYMILNSNETQACSPTKKIPNEDFENSKFSRKDCGLIKAYAANFHKATQQGSLNSDVRISIVTNLKKNQNRSQAISYFALYKCKNTTNNLSDFIRDSFHSTFLQKTHLETTTDVGKCVQEGMRIIKQRYEQDLAQLTTFGGKGKRTSKLSYDFLIGLFLGRRMILASNGGLGLYISKKGGQFQYICAGKPSIEEIVLDGRQEFFLFVNELQCKKDAFDLLKKVWASLLSKAVESDSLRESLHTIAGATADEIMKVLVKTQDANVAVILLLFEEVQAILKPNDSLYLPYIN